MKIRKCKDCWKEVDHNGITRRCKACEYKKQEEKQRSQKPKELKRTRLNPISQKRVTRLKETWWEALTFKKVWDKQPNICVNCWKYILEPQNFCFAHIIAKWQNPDLRDHTNNIWLVCSTQCHKKFDSRVNKCKKAIWNEKLEQKIKNGKNVIDLIINN